jgi:hypothetical protein
VVPQPFSTHPIDQFDHGNTLTLPPRRVNQKLLNLGPKQEAYFTRLHYRDDNDPFMDDSTDGCSFFAELNNTRCKNISRTRDSIKTCTSSNFRAFYQSSDYSRAIMTCQLVLSVSRSRNVTTATFDGRLFAGSYRLALFYGVIYDTTCFRNCQQLI